MLRTFNIRIRFIHREGLIGHNGFVSRLQERTNNEGDDFIGSASENNLIAFNTKLISKLRR